MDNMLSNNSINEVFAKSEKRDLLEKMYVCVVREILALNADSLDRRTATELVEQIRLNIHKLSENETEYEHEDNTQVINEFSCWYINDISNNIIELMKDYCIIDSRYSYTFEIITKERIEKLIDLTKDDVIIQYKILIYLEKLYLDT